MKLCELFANNPIYDLGEDNDITRQLLDKQDVSFDVAHSRPVGTFNGLEIWGSKYFGDKLDLYGILNKQRDILSWCLFDNAKNDPYLTFNRAYTSPQYRGNDYTLTIINFLIEKIKAKIIIDKDEVTSPDSRRMLFKWFSYDTQKRHFSMKAFFNGKEVNDLNKILKDGSKNDVYIIMEDVYGRKLPRYGGSGKRILHDIVWY